MVDDRRFITDAVDRGIADIRELQTVDRTESHKLTDVDGIGPSTAEELEDAGIEKPVELGRVTPNQLEAIEGIGPKKADKLASRFQFRQSARFGGEARDTPADIREEMADRSANARRTDRSFNAPVTLDEETWLEDPNRWDYPGVDTIPEQRRAERARAKAQRGEVSIQSESIPGRVEGQHRSGSITVDPGGFDPVSTLAHEVGHAADEQAGSADEKINESVFEDEELLDEAETLAERRRPFFSDRDQLQQDEKSELFADAFAVATEEPRAARREAPKLTRKVEEEVILDFGRF